MFKNSFLTFFLLFSSLITIYPSKIENTDLFDYCYSFEKIISRNLVEKSINFSNKLKNYAKDISIFGSNKTKGALANKIINKYKSSNNFFLVNFLPNKFYCLSGYWIEKINPGTFNSIFNEKVKQKINKYKNIKKEVDVFIQDINSEYKSIKKEINELF